MTPWVKRLIIANVIVYFLEQTVGGLTRVPSSSCRPSASVAAVDDRHVHVRARQHHAHPVQHDRAVFLWPAGRGTDRRRTDSSRCTASAACSVRCVSLIFAPYAGDHRCLRAPCSASCSPSRVSGPTAQILIFGFLPIEARVAVVLMVDLVALERLPGSSSGVADFAHLGGFVGGWLYLTWLDRRQGTRNSDRRSRRKSPRTRSRTGRSVDPTSIHEVNRDEVNRILDKISAKGLASLTAEERLFLSNFVPPDDRVPPVS